MSEEGPLQFSQSRLGTYLKCPRMYAYQYDWDVDTPDRTERYLIQGRAYHAAIERVCSTVDGHAPQDIEELAADTVRDAWQEHVDPDEFESRSQQEYYRRQTEVAIGAYFDAVDGPGIDHARNSIAVERSLETTHRGIPVRGYADNIVRTDSGLHIFDYKRNLGGVLSSYTAERIPGHLNGEEYEPGRVKNAIQAAIYIEALRDSDLYEQGWDIGFSFYGILDDIEFTPGVDGYSIDVSGRERDITDIYETHSETIWALIERGVTGIAEEAFTPEPWEEILDNTCEDCDYRAMCPDFLSTEVG